MTLYVRALSPISLSTSQTGTGTEFRLDQNSSKLLPLWVAQEAGFQRLWTAGKVQVATDSGFSNVVTSIPAAETETVTTVNGYAGAVTLAASDVGLGNVTNTSDATKNSAVAALTNKDLTSGNTFPTFNQNTTGSAAKLTTARTINGTSFDGSANITIITDNSDGTATTVS